MASGGRDCAGRRARSQRLEYARLRAEQQSSAEGERELAQWCLKHKLEAEARYHLRKLLEYAPDDAQALRELALYPYEGEMLGKAEIATRKKEAESRQRAPFTGNRAWPPGGAISTLRTIRNATKRCSDSRITDVGVIVPIEAVLADKDRPADSTFEREMIGVLGNMRDSRGHVCFSARGGLSQWPDAQQAATAQLKRHELTDYAPDALGNMFTLVASKYVVTVDPSGTVRYQQHLKRSGRRPMTWL